MKVSPYSYERFLIIDDTVYHIGASLKDLGKAKEWYQKVTDQGDEEIEESVKEIKRNAKKGVPSGTPFLLNYIANNQAYYLPKSFITFSTSALGIPS